MNNVASLFAREIKFKTLLEANEMYALPRVPVPGNLLTARRHVDPPLRSSAPVQRHLSRTYAALAFSIACAAIGSWVHLQTHAGGVLTSIAALGLVMGLATTSRSGKTDSPQRLAMFAGFGLLKGLSIGGLVEEIIDIDPAILVTAFLGTVFIFGSFSVAALLCASHTPPLHEHALTPVRSQAPQLPLPRRPALLRHLHDDALLLCLPLLPRQHRLPLQPGTLPRTLAQPRTAADPDPDSQYVGLLVFVGYIVYDTQLIIELAANGETDFLWHAVQLFIGARRPGPALFFAWRGPAVGRSPMRCPRTMSCADVVGVFVRLAIILAKNAKESNNRRRK